MKQGFTLMELLITIIIIGILSSVALPQYTRAENKARAMEAVANLNALQKGIDMYCTQFRCMSSASFLKTGGTRLDVDLTGNLTCGSDSCDSKHFAYTAECDETGSCSVVATPISKFQNYLPTLTNTRTKSGRTVTWARTCQNGTKDDNMCKGLIGAGFADISPAQE